MGKESQGPLLKGSTMCLCSSQLRGTLQRAATSYNLTVPKLGIWKAAW